MKTHSERSRHRRSVQLEFLENRSLLSQGIPGVSTAEVQSVPKTETVALTFAGTRVASSLPAEAGHVRYKIEIEASGDATPWGKFALQESHTLDVDLATGVFTVSGGTAVFKLAHGDKIFASYEGGGQYSSGDPGYINLDLQYTVTGGAKQHEGATGTLDIRMRAPTSGVTAPVTGEGNGLISLEG